MRATVAVYDTKPYDRESLTRAAGADAVFMEVHEEPSRAKSDAANALWLDRLETLVTKLKRISAAAREDVAAGAGARAR